MKTSIHRDISRRREKTQKAAISQDSQTLLAILCPRPNASGTFEIMKKQNINDLKEEKEGKNNWFLFTE